MPRRNNSSTPLLGARDVLGESQLPTRNNLNNNHNNHNNNNNQKILCLNNNGSPHADLTAYGPNWIHHNKPMRVLMVTTGAP